MSSAKKNELTLEKNRIALGVSYNGRSYNGWQSQINGNTVQDKLETALAKFCTHPVGTICAGRTDAGVHGLMQVVHFDTPVDRTVQSWVRGVNAFLEKNIAVQWAKMVTSDFHSRGSALTRRYRYVLLDSPVRPSVEHGLVGWVFRPLNKDPMVTAAQILLGEHDFSSFRASQCQAKTPVKTMHSIEIEKRGSYWYFEFEANAFLHHMIRNIMGCLVAIGRGDHPVIWLKEVLLAKNRKVAAPTFAADGLYFLGPTYDEKWHIPSQTPALDSLFFTF